jgi:hypothetical protein
MSLTLADEQSGAVDRAANPQRLWQRLARALDAYFVDRSRRAMPAATLRRSKHKIDRCRRLMRKSAATASAATISSRRLART